MSNVAEKRDVSSEESSEESSSSEEEDETGKEWTEDIEKTFLKTLSSLKSKDPKIYDSQVKFFDENSTITLGQKSSEKVKKEQPMFLRDYERKMILERGAVMSDEEEEDHLKRQTSESLTYVEEQKALKDNFKKFLHSDTESSDDDTACAGFLKVKTKTASEKNQEEEEYVEWLKGQKSELADKEVENELQPLRSYWTDPSLNEGELFLRDYILNKRYIDPSQGSNPNDDELSFSEEERCLEECEEYEQRYNFRFEEPDKDFIKTYPRKIESSLRRRDEKRKQQREEKKKRREGLLLQKQLEVKQLKKQKKAEMLERIKKLKEITGNPQVGFDDNDLEKDFSPDEYDRKMNELFSEEFYAGEDMDEKPVFSDASSEYEYNNDDDDFNSEENKFENVKEEPFSEENSKHEVLASNDADAADDYAPIEDTDFNMDCDYDPNQSRSSKLKKQTRSSRRKGHKKTKFAEVISKKKPLFNPADKSFQKYVDEYYGLDFEDVIGDMPCRFKYRKVTPNSFGLSIEEILAADDKDLNKWCSMQKIDTIRPEQQEKFDLKVYSKRSNDERLKKKYLPSLYGCENDEAPAGTTSESNVAQEKSKASNNNDNPRSNKKKRKRSKHKNNPNKDDESSLPHRTQKNNKAPNNENQLQSKKRKHFNPQDASSQPHIAAKKNEANREIHNKKRKHSFHENFSGNDKFKKRKLSQFESGKSSFKPSENTIEAGLSEDRLKAYGINPKKFRNKLKYGQNKR